MNNINTFQLIVLGVFLALAVAGIFLFATFGGFGGPSFDRVIIWGTMDEKIVNSFIGTLRNENEELSEVEYVEKDSDTYRDELIEALASGSGPDLFMLTDDLILLEENKIVPIPYSQISEREFRDSFIEAGELFLTNDGILALPFSIDPIILYWNRDLFSRAGVAQPPQFWDELFTLSEVLTIKDPAGNITQSVASLGEFQNVNHAKQILITLIMQAGTPIVSRFQDGVVESVLSNRFGFSTIPGEAALRFYTEFSNPVKAIYSWNRSLPSSKQAFLAGDLALYIAPASEITELRSLNPNLNFDVAAIPQSRGNPEKITYGSITALAISKQSENIQGSYLTAELLTSSKGSLDFSEKTGLPPVRRDLLSDLPQDAYLNIVYKSALISKGFLDPNPKETNNIFKNMVESVTSGRENLSTALSIADKQLNNLLKAR